MPFGVRLVARAAAASCAVLMVVACTSAVTGAATSLASARPPARVAPAPFMAHALAPRRAEARTAQATDVQRATGQRLTAERCTGCHGLSRIATAGRSEAAWKATVDEMIAWGAEATADEAAAIVAYLAEAFPARP